MNACYLYKVLGQWGRTPKNAEGGGGGGWGVRRRRTGSAKTFPFSPPDPAGGPPAFLIVPTNRESGTGWNACKCAQTFTNHLTSATMINPRFNVYSVTNKKTLKWRAYYSEFLV